MNRSLLVVLGLIVAAGAVVLGLTGRGHAQGTGQFPFTNPFAPPSSAPKHPLLQGSYSSSSNQPKKTTANDPEPNADIKVTPQAGEWMICVHVYKGDEAHQMARQLVSVLRDKEYGLWAYIYDHTPEARLKLEMYRQEQIDKHINAFKVIGQPPPKEIKIRLPKKIEVQDEVGVLVGGYKDMKTARAALDELKKLPMPRPYPDDEEIARLPEGKKPDTSRCVKMDKMFMIQKNPVTGQKEAKEVYVNPLANGLVVRNPSLPKNTNKESTWDLALLRSLNADEPFSLLKCPKKITLVVKEYRLPTYIQQGNSSPDTGKKSIFDQTPERTDLAYHNAHNLAGMLKERGKFETYVLHDRTVSLVTIGSFDSLEDPRLKEVQGKISEYHQKVYSLAQTTPQAEGLLIFPIGVPMKVPR